MRESRLSTTRRLTALGNVEHGEWCRRRAREKRRLRHDWLMAARRVTRGQCKDDPSKAPPSLNTVCKWQTIRDEDGSNLFGDAARGEDGTSQLHIGGFEATLTEASVGLDKSADKGPLLETKAEQLRSAGIKTVISLTVNEPQHASGVEYFAYKLNDSEETDLESVWDEVCNRIDGGLRKPGGVLVHCDQGVSRSGSTVAAYLMRRLAPMKPVRALQLVKMSRKQVNPNPSFLRQLNLWETRCRAGKRKRDPDL